MSRARSPQLGNFVAQQLQLLALVTPRPVHAGGHGDRHSGCG
jgi:hypothetical protein